MVVTAKRRRLCAKSAEIFKQVLADGGSGHCVLVTKWPVPETWPIKNHVMVSQLKHLLGGNEV